VLSCCFIALLAGFQLHGNIRRWNRADGHFDWAANYQDHGNKGAVLIFSDPAEPPEPLIFESAEEAASIKEVTWMQHTG